MLIEDYVKHLRKSYKKQEKIVIEAIRRNAPMILDMNTNQLLEGKGSDGQVLATYPDGPYKSMKQDMNPRAGGNVDLRLTGQFHNSFYLETPGKMFPVVFRARDYKEARLLDRYGKKIFGLTPKNKDEVVEELRPEVYAEFKTRIFLVR